MFRFGAFWLAIFLAVPAVSFADTTTQNLDALTMRADQLMLDQSPEWLGLLHFRDNPRLSEISPGPFFLSPDGRTDPRAELVATLKGAMDPLQADPNDHILCRYPARMRYLRRQLDWTPPQQPACDLLQRWRRDGEITGISMVFASGDLGNPASFFGHILMKFNESGPQQDSIQNLDARSVNFGALVPENENAFVYMARGVAGGYPSSYSSTAYFQQRHDYGETQLRDLWEYRLNLDTDQVQLLVDHTWELQDARNTYYFLTRNCAYEFATVLAMVLGQSTMPDIKIWSTPADLFQKLSAMTRADGRPVVDSVNLVASRQQGFRQTYAALTDLEKSALRDLLFSLIGQDTTRQRQSLENLSPSSQSRVLEAGLNYASFGREKFNPDSPTQTQAQMLQRQLVLLRLAQPAGAELVPERSTQEPPHRGHRSSMVQVTPLSHSHFGMGTEIRLRPAYSDLLSLDAGVQPYSAVAMGDVRLMSRDDQLWLRQLDIIRIDAFNVSPTGLPYDRARAWKFRLGAEDRDLACDRCLVGFAEGAVGTSQPIGNNAAAAVFLEARGGLATDAKEFAETGPSIAVVVKPGSAVRLSAEAGYLATIVGTNNDRFEANAVMGLGQNQTWDVRLRAGYLRPRNNQSMTEVGLSVAWFF